MLKRIFILMAVLLVGCVDDEEKTIPPLKLAKLPYTGTELRTDGYYYSDLTPENDYGVVVLYRDGVCIRTFADSDGQNLFDYIENSILRNQSLISRFWEKPMSVGVFNIISDSLKYEVWEAAAYGNTITISNSAKILNDTTFRLTKRVENTDGSVSSPNLLFRFKQFSPKPDSTNKYIK